MSTSNTITKTDLKNILNNLSLKQASIPVGHKNLLWTNPDTTAAFAAQTISLDLSDYNEVEIVAQHWSNNGTKVMAKAEIGNVGIFVIPNYDNAYITTKMQMAIVIKSIVSVKGSLRNDLSLLMFTGLLSMLLHVYGPYSVP
jgi:hypothetical protein